MAEPVESQREDETVVFREIQRIRQPWIWITLGTGFLLALVFTGPASLPFVGAGIGIYLVRLTTEVREDGVYVRYGPLHRSFRRIPFSEIERREITGAGKLLQGGPGIIGPRKIDSYSTSRGKGVKLYRTNENPVLIGSQRPDELMEAIAAHYD